MDKITEEVITRLIQRIEKVEDEMRQLKEQKPKTGLATPGQLRFIKGLGGVPKEGMTMKEASAEIEKLKAMKERKQEPKEEMYEGDPYL